MPHLPLPEGPEGEQASSAAAREIQMRWLQRFEDDGEPILLEISVGTPWASTDLGRHLRTGIVDVALEAPEDIYENVVPEPPGTRVPLGVGGQVLVTCEYGGAVFNE